MTSNYRFYILLDKLDSTTTRVKILNYLKLNWIGKFRKKSIYKRLETKWDIKMKKLEEVGLNQNKVLDSNFQF